MQVALNISSNNVKPSFKSKPILNGFNFGLKMKSLHQDTVEIPRLRLRASQFYSQVCKKISNPTIDEITKIVDKFSERYLREDVLAVMHTLTQYSNIDSVCGLYDSFKRNNIESFRGFGSYNYYDLRRSLLDISDEEMRKLSYRMPIGYLPSTSDLFAYLFDKNEGKYKLPNARSRATILDKRTVKIMQEYKDCAPIKLHQLINGLDKFVYIKNFENGCNIFEDQTKLETKIEENLAKLAKLKEKNPEDSTQKLLNVLFNKANRDAIEKLEIPYVVIESNSKRKPTVEDIVENLSQKIPSEKEFIETIDNFITPLASKDDMRLKYLNDIKDKFNIYTFKTISEKLKVLKKNIEDEVLKNGRDPNEILYFVPNYRKSFGLIATIYQKVNNIPEDRFIDIDLRTLDDRKDRISLTDGTSKGQTVVILDDASITGESLVFELDIRQNFAPEIMYATIFSTPRAKDNLEYYKSPKLISVDCQSAQSLISRVAENSHFNNHTMLLFPYVAPDNNIPILRELVEKFYPVGGFVQEPWDY